MSNNDIINTAKELAELKALRTELEDEISALEDKLKAEMSLRETDELSAGAYTIKWTEYTTMRFDASAFKKAEPELAAAYTKTATARRFSIN